MGVGVPGKIPHLLLRPHCRLRRPPGSVGSDPTDPPPLGRGVVVDHECPRPSWTPPRTLCPREDSGRRGDRGEESVPVSVRVEHPLPVYSVVCTSLSSRQTEEVVVGSDTRRDTVPRPLSSTGGSVPRARGVVMATRSTRKDETDVSPSCGGLGATLDSRDPWGGRGSELPGRDPEVGVSTRVTSVRERTFLTPKGPSEGSRGGITWVRVGREGSTGTRHVCRSGLGLARDTPG